MFLSSGRKRKPKLLFPFWLLKYVQRKNLRIKINTWKKERKSLTAGIVCLIASVEIAIHENEAKKKVWTRQEKKCSSNTKTPICYILLANVLEGFHEKRLVSFFVFVNLLKKVLPFFFGRYQNPGNREGKKEEKSLGAITVGKAAWKTFTPKKKKIK